MEHWPFVIAVYAITLLGGAGLLVQSWAAMRRSERRAEKLRDRR